MSNRKKEVHVHACTFIRRTIEEDGRMPLSKGRAFFATLSRRITIVSLSLSHVRVLRIEGIIKKGYYNDSMIIKINFHRCWDRSVYCIINRNIYYPRIFLSITDWKGEVCC